MYACSYVGGPTRTCNKHANKLTKLCSVHRYIHVHTGGCVEYVLVAHSYVGQWVNMSMGIQWDMHRMYGTGSTR